VADIAVQLRQCVWKFFSAIGGIFAGPCLVATAHWPSELRSYFLLKAIKEKNNYSKLSKNSYKIAIKKKDIQTGDSDKCRAYALGAVDALERSLAFQSIYIHGHF
jgi:hypothetical protein